MKKLMCSAIQPFYSHDYENLILKADYVKEDSWVIYTSVSVSRSSLAHAHTGAPPDASKVEE